jgi:hypothetical protein
MGVPPLAKKPRAAFNKSSLIMVYRVLCGSAAGLISPLAVAS